MEPKKGRRRRQLRKKLLYKYRLVILNEETFEEKLSLKLNRVNVFVVGSVFAIFLIVSTTILIAFTPLREYIPGYSSAELKKEAIRLTFKTDSLERELYMSNQYLGSIKKVLTGDIKTNEINKDSLWEQYRNDPNILDLAPSREDSLLREEVALEDKYNLFTRATTRAGVLLFSPVSGTISNEYNPKTKHYAVDIVAPNNAPVKAVSDGTVIFAEWTAETGYVIIIEHGYGLISVYKHNSSVNKSQGALVKAGEVIANVGNTGEYTTGPHLHFELWSDGYPVNPMNYIDFK